MPIETFIETLIEVMALSLIRLRHTIISSTPMLPLLLLQRLVHAPSQFSLGHTISAAPLGHAAHASATAERRPRRSSQRIGAVLVVVCFGAIRLWVFSLRLWSSSQCLRSRAHTNTSLQLTLPGPYHSFRKQRGKSLSCDDLLQQSCIDFSW